MPQLGRKLKLGLLIMATLTLPTQATVNVVSTTSDYSAKSNLKETVGSYMTEATMLVYDEILRYQRNVAFTNGLDEAALAAFDFDNFAGNVLWLMDELVGVESDWIQNASPGIKDNTAYDEFYLLAGGNLQVSDGQMATPSENAKKSEIKRLFTSTLKQNKDSRVVLNKFISQVA